jgi:hypothetical protein
MFTDILRDETVRRGLPSIEVDTTTTEDYLAERVTNVFGFVANRNRSANKA